MKILRMGIKFLFMLLFVTLISISVLAQQVIKSKEVFRLTEGETAMLYNDNERIDIRLEDVDEEFNGEVMLRVITFRNNEIVKEQKFMLGVEQLGRNIELLKSGIDDYNRGHALLVVMDTPISGVTEITEISPLIPFTGKVIEPTKTPTVKLNKIKSEDIRNWLRSVVAKGNYKNPSNRITGGAVISRPGVATSLSRAPGKVSGGARRYSRGIRR